MRRVLKERRLALGMSQDVVAEKLGIVRAHYTRIENGTSNPSIRVYFKLKEILDLTDEEFMLEDENPPRKAG